MSAETLPPGPPAPPRPVPRRPIKDEFPFRRSPTRSKVVPSMVTVASIHSFSPESTKVWIIVS